MSYKNYRGPVNTNSPYKPGTLGKIAMFLASTGGIVALISIIAGFFVKDYMGYCIQVAFIAMVIAMLAGLVLIVDIVVFNKRIDRENAKIKKKTEVEKKERSLKDLLRFIIGFGLGLLLGFLIWGR